MIELLLVALVIGLDNLVVGVGLGGLSATRARRTQLAVAFGLAEGLLPLLGLLIGSGLAGLAPAAEGIGPLSLLVAGGLALAGARTAGRSAALLGSRGAVVLLPLALGLDNLFAGVGVGALGYGVALPALVLGGVSAAACWIGLALGEVVVSRRWARRLNRPYLLSGAWLTVAAVVMLTLELG